VRADGPTGGSHPTGLQSCRGSRENHCTAQAADGNIGPLGQEQQPPQTRQQDLRRSRYRGANWADEPMM
jgi:hypothetical protein